MSIVLTLRRFTPGTEPQEPGDDAAEFALGLDGMKLLESPDIIHFFDLWHVVHFLSCGQEWHCDLPAGFVMGGDDWHQTHPEEEPPRLLSPEQVRAAYEHLRGLPHDVLDSRLAALHAEGCEVYRAPTTDEEDGYVRHAFGMIRDFLGAAALSRQAVLLANS